MSSRIALRGSYGQHSPKAVRVGRPQWHERLEVTLVLRRRQAAPHPWAAGHYHSHEELEALYGADPADIEAVEQIASERHFSITHVDASARTITLAGNFGDLTAFFGADVEVHRIDNRVYRSRRGHLHVPPELAGRVIAITGFDGRPVARSLKAIHPQATNTTGFSPRDVAALYQ